MAFIYIYILFIEIHIRWFFYLISAGWPKNEFIFSLLTRISQNDTRSDYLCTVYNNRINGYVLNNKRLAFWRCHIYIYIYSENCLTHSLLKYIFLYYMHFLCDISVTSEQFSRLMYSYNIIVHCRDGVVRSYILSRNPASEVWRLKRDF